MVITVGVAPFERDREREGVAVVNCFRRNVAMWTSNRYAKDGVHTRLFN